MLHHLNPYVRTFGPTWIHWSRSKPNGFLGWPCWSCWRNYLCLCHYKNRQVQVDFLHSYRWNSFRMHRLVARGYATWKRFRILDHIHLPYDYLWFEHGSLVLLSGICCLSSSRNWWGYIRRNCMPSLQYLRIRSTLNFRKYFQGNEEQKR